MTIRWSRRIATVTAASLALPLTAAAAGADPRTPPDPAPPTFTDVEVHDPSLVTTEAGEHWVFGSHLAAAKTDDFVQWEQTANHVTPDNPLFEDVTTELAETFEWAETDTLWAADVHRLESDGRYYMYYNACEGSSPRSALGVAVADDVDGPYEDLGIILRSGHREGEGPAEDGTTYDAHVHPNAVDPDTFYDAEGDLWMVYGSFSGGIFILAMDEETGLPEPGQGYGTHLVGGNHSRIEGPAMMYDPDTEYYYLFTSFGGLTADEGYNMRVMRSTSPDGPYEDAAGDPMSEVRSDPDLPIFDDASIEGAGTKLMGNYLFQREVGDPGEGIGDGRVSPGHNTVHRDPETGQMLLIFHSRFPQQGERHQVRVREMRMNADGWPVVAPYRYAGGHDATSFLRKQVVGDYRFVVHDKAITPEIREATTVTLHQDGSVSGTVDGRWRLSDQNRLHLRVDGAEYDGVVSREWDPTGQRWITTFSVVGDQGVPLWGSALEPMTDQEIVDAVVADLDLPTADAVVADLELPTTGTHGATVAWTSSAPDVVAPTGEVTRPGADDGDATVTLTAEVTSGDVTATTTFAVTVPAEPEPGLVARYAFDGDLASTGDAATGTVTGTRVDTTGGQVSYTDGAHGQGLVLDGSSGVRLPDGLITGHDYSVSLWLAPEARTPFTTAFFGARDTTSWTSLLPQAGWGEGNSLLWSGTDPYYDGDLGTRLPLGEWSHVAYTVAAGEVTIYLDGEVVHTGSDFPDVFTTADGVFALGVNWWDAPYRGAVDDLQVYLGALDADQVAAVGAGEVAEL
ncbi:family 43 glycosylhydrolase [Isoptericola haloaureus]|uniref:Family 43 glycosylhydrolase n=1 Tax=Isoptericola haloaureus TaxID=1542902 RepID=A0ABU7Z682_9MICO